MPCQCGAADCPNCRSLENPALMVCCCCDEELDQGDVRRGNVIVDPQYGEHWCWYCFHGKCGRKLGEFCEGKGEREI